MGAICLKPGRVVEKRPAKAADLFRDPLDTGQLFPESPPCSLGI